MKESVLVIDISSDIAVCSVVITDGATVSPNAKSRRNTLASVPGIFKSLKPFNSKTIHNEGDTDTSDPASEQTSNQVLTINEFKALKSPDTQLLRSLQTDEEDALISFGSFLTELVSGISTPFDGCLLILPSIEHLSFNLSLPFTDKKNLNKIIDLEIQDSTPFDLDDFLVDYKIVNKKTNGESNIFVNCINKKLVENILKAFKAVNIEPHCITLPAAALSGLLWAVPNLSRQNIAIIHCSKKEISLLLCVAGDAIGLKTIPVTENLIILLTQFITSQEVRLEIKIDQIILVGDINLSKVISENLTGKNSIFYDIKKYTNFQPDNSFLQAIANSEKDDLSLTLLGSQLVLESPIVPVLSNFRAREFAFIPKLKELKKAGISLLPSTAVMVLVIVCCLAAYCLIRNNQINYYRSTLQNRISTMIPGFNAPESLEVDSLQKELKKLDQQLKELGSTSAITPLQAFAIISRDLPSGNGIGIRKLSITPNRILIEGSAPDYSAVEKIERMLKRSKDAFCKIKKDTGATAVGQADKRSFTFDILICDSNNREPAR